MTFFADVVTQSMERMSQLVEEASRLEIYRSVAKNHLPLSVETLADQASPIMTDEYTLAVAESQQAIAEQWNNPNVEQMRREFEPDYWFEIVVEHGSNWDQWDGKPTKYITKKDIRRLTRKYKVDNRAYRMYFALTVDEKIQFRKIFDKVTAEFLFGRDDDE